MKRFLWAFSGIAAAFLITFADAFPANALEFVDDSIVFEESEFEDSYSDVELLMSTYASAYCNGNSVNDSKCLQDIYNAISDSSTDGVTISLGVLNAMASHCFGPNASQVQSTSICMMLKTMTDDLGQVKTDLTQIGGLISNINIRNGRMDANLASLVSLVSPLNDTLLVLIEAQNNANIKMDRLQAKVDTLVSLQRDYAPLITDFNSDFNTKLDRLIDKITSGDASAVAAVNAAANQAHSDSQAQLAAQNKANEIAEEQKNFVTDTSTPEAGDIANSDSLPSVGLLPSGPLDSILLLPVNLLNSIIQSFGGTCKPIVAPLPFVDEDVTFPCMTDTLYTGALAPVGVFIGGVASAFILYGYFKHLYKKVDRAVSLETTDEDEWGIL